MAKKNKQEIRECHLCVHSLMHDKQLHCKTRMKAATTFANSLKVYTQIECSFYKKKRNEN